jgi:hypothetical protein
VSDHSLVTNAKCHSSDHVLPLMMVVSAVEVSWGVLWQISGIL